MKADVLRSDVLARRVLSAVAAVDLISFLTFLGEERARALADGVALTTFAELFSRPLVSWTIIIIGVAGAVVFSRDSGRLWAGVVTLGALALLSTTHAELFGSPWRHLYYSGLCLSGWLLGLVVSRWCGVPADESYARMGSTALLGAAYLNGGISKVIFGGFDWAFGLPIQAIVVAQDGMVADSAVSAYRAWIVATPVLAGLFSFATIALELAAPLMIVGGAIGIAVALGLVAMHLNILVLTHILYWEAMVFLVLFGVLSRKPAPEAVTETTPALLVRGRPFVLSTALLLVCGLIGISHQGRRFTLWQEASAANQTSVTAVKAPPPVARATAGVTGGAPGAAGVPGPRSMAPIQTIGPFAVGQTLIVGWNIDALELTDDGFIAMLAGKPGRVRFEVTCSASQHRSPFDLGPAHIFYSTGVAFSDLEAAGLAFQSRLRDEGEGQALCERVTDWRTAAQAERPH